MNRGIAMNRHGFRSSVVAVLILAVAVIIGQAAPASAQPEPVPTLISANPEPGASDEVTGGGCVARTSVRVQFDSVLLVTTRSTATGSYDAHLVIPVSAAPGPHRITVLCASPGGAATFTAAVAVGGLASTGTDTGVLGGWGVAALLAGCALLLAGRRPRRALGQMR